jgi:hypothetical protein
MTSEKKKKDLPWPWGASLKDTESAILVGTSSKASGAKNKLGGVDERGGGVKVRIKFRPT